MPDYDVAVIGAGPGGYAAAIRAAQLGLKALCVEREAVGGVCLNWGCIPSKALLRNAEVLTTVKRAAEFGIAVEGVSANYAAGVARSRKVVDRLTKGVGSLLRKNAVDYLEGDASIVDAEAIEVDGRRIEAAHLIIATGASPAALPGVQVDGEVVLTYREAIVDERSPERVVIVGGGPIGVEFASIHQAYGASTTIVEALPRLLPQEDEEASQALARAFAKRGIQVLAGAAVSSVEVVGGIATVQVDGPEGRRTLEADRVLVATGVRPNTDGLGAENAGATLRRGFIEVDDNLSANGGGVYAVGDVNGRLPLAHVAQAEGVFVAEHIAGLAPKPLDYLSMPRAAYCSPQVAGMGLTEGEARAQGYEVKVGKFPFVANGKALAAGESEGFAKIVADAVTGELLGAHVVGHEATELLGELSLTRMLDGTDIELGRLVKVHPSMSEAVKEAALAAEGCAVHL